MANPVDHIELWVEFWGNLLQEIVGDSFEVAHKPVANNLPYRWEIMTVVPFQSLIPIQFDGNDVHMLNGATVEKQSDYLRSKVALGLTKVRETTLPS